MSKDGKNSFLKLIGSGLKIITGLAGKLLRIFGYSVLFIITATASLILMNKHRKETSKV